MVRTLSAGLALTVLAAIPALAQQSPPPTCAAPEHRQFDFWIGAWDVLNPDGQKVGVNTITVGLNGCVLHEQYESLRGAYRGSSYNVYDRTAQRWHQTWVDNTGLLLQLDGRFADGRMLLEGRTRRSDGSEQLERITWSANPDGSVRQLWHRSTDGGATWNVAFDGKYVKQ